MEMNNKETRRVVIGITAHVDAGKTTLADAWMVPPADQQKFRLLFLRLRIDCKNQHIHSHRWTLIISGPVLC